MDALPRLEKTLETVEQARPLDRVAVRLRDIVRKAVSASPAAADLLHGVPLGHPLHPALVLVPLGMWTSATALDLVPGTGPAVPVLIAGGIVSAVPAAAAGLVDWSELHEEQQRVGLVHATSNILGLTCFAASLVARLRGHRSRARLLSFAGLGYLGVAGYLGGHLSYRQSAGANHVEDLPHRIPAGWHDLCAIDDLPTGRPAVMEVAGEPLLVLREGMQIHVLADKCSHLSGPLHEGQVSVINGAQCVRCPWHGSTFRVSDGTVVHGPATGRQPVFDVRVQAGRVEVRLPNAG